MCIRNSGAGRTAIGAARPNLRPAALAGFALLALAACVQPTAYGPASDGQGYADQEIAENRYRVTFGGNSATPRETVENFLLYRAAEITLASGNDYFVLLEYDVERDVTYRRYVEYPWGWPGYGAYYGRYPTWPYAYDPFYGPLFPGYAEVTEKPIDKYRAFATIAVHSGEPPEDDADAYAARDVIERLGPEIERPGGDAGS